MVINMCHYKSTGAGTFTITDTKLCISIVTFSTQSSEKLLQQLKSGFKRTMNWKNINEKYQ